MRSSPDPTRATGSRPDGRDVYHPRGVRRFDAPSRQRACTAWAKTSPVRAMKAHRDAPNVSLRMDARSDPSDVMLPDPVRQGSRAGAVAPREVDRAIAELNRARMLGEA